MRYVRLHIQRAVIHGPSYKPSIWVGFSTQVSKLNGRWKFKMVNKSLQSSMRIPWDIDSVPNDDEKSITLTDGQGTIEGSTDTIFAATSAIVVLAALWFIGFVRPDVVPARKPQKKSIKLNLRRIKIQLKNHKP